jgi:Ice-binding-like
MFSVPRFTTRLAVVASFAAFLSAACSTDVTHPSPISGPIVPAKAALFADRPATPSTPSGFAVLANAAVTCTNGTITGDVGTFQATPTGSVTQTSCPITGAVDVGTAASIQAYNAFLAAYTSTASTPCGVVLTGTLAGMTLSPGVYCFDAAATLTGVLTLQGPPNGVWLFKVGTSGTGALTGTSFSVVMAGGGLACNVTWWAAQAATLTDSHFLGSILAGAAITLTRGTFGGNAWATADVTITGTAVVGCAGSPNPGKPGHGKHKDKDKCNQGVGNGPEGCDPGHSNHHNSSNDENGGTPGDPGRQGHDRH